MWSDGDRRAPHKPLLLLYALAKCSRGEKRLFSFKEADKPLQGLLIDYGHASKYPHSLYPFWYLKNDGLWEHKNVENIQFRKGKPEPRKSALIECNVHGGFKEEIYDVLLSDKKLITELASLVLEKNFPESIHEDLIQAVGLQLDTHDKKTRRDPDFRNKILTAYEHRCCICSYNIQINNTDVGLEAAHIKWHQAGGPDIESNGLALCSLHHKLFDRGVLTVSNDQKILVSQKAHGYQGVKAHLLDFHDKEINQPQSTAYCPDKQYLDWHFNEVFCGPPRDN